MPKLSINAGLCTKCGTGAESCPVKGIDINSDNSVIQNPCIYCWHCTFVCPESAIEADWSMLVGMAPGNYKRYAKALYDAEARGEFRWLMDPASIKLDDPLYAQLKRKSNRKDKS